MMAGDEDVRLEVRLIAIRLLFGVGPRPVPYHPFFFSACSSSATKRGLGKGVNRVWSGSEHRPTNGQKGESDVDAAEGRYDGKLARLVTVVCGSRCLWLFFRPGGGERGQQEEGRKWVRGCSGGLVLAGIFFLSFLLGLDL